MKIKISQESLDAFKKEKELIPAPIDNKNVTTDWIEDVFDNQSCIWGKKNSAVGYINEEPVIAAWDRNLLLWQFSLITSLEDSISLSILKDRLNAAHDPDGDLVEDLKVVGNLLMHKFYWKNEK